MPHAFFMEKALQQAENALRNNEFPVGCVIEYGGEIVASGCRTGTADGIPSEVDHAEIIALRRLSRLKDEIDRNRATLYCTLEPCLMCFGAILLSGIGKIVYAYEDVMGGGTKVDLASLTPLYRSLNCSIAAPVMRSKSLKLFQAYFSNPENTYWKGSLLARYTLSTD